MQATFGNGMGGLALYSLIIVGTFFCCFQSIANNSRCVLRIMSPPHTCTPWLHLHPIGLPACTPLWQGEEARHAPYMRLQPWITPLAPLRAPIGGLVVLMSHE